MDAFVLDVSACIPWCCGDETTQASEQMLEWAMDGSALHVPSLWTWEILNGVAVVIKWKRITADRGKEFLVQVAALNIIVDEPLIAFSSATPWTKPSGRRAGRHLLLAVCEQRVAGGELHEKPAAVY